MRKLTQRVAGVVAAATAFALVVTGCSADTSVEIDTPAQAEGSFSGDMLTEFEAAVDQAMLASGASGAIVGVWAPWSGSWVEGIGTQSPEDSTPVTTDMQFRIAALTRPMTCDVLYGVAADGLVSLDDTVNTYVAGVPDLANVTLEQLCESTSGIGSYTPQLAGEFASNPDRVWNPRELASYGLGKERTTEPGAAYVSSDAGYLLLGLALERATSKSAATLIEEYVTEPLDLEATSLPAASPAVPGPGTALRGNLAVENEEGVLDCTNPLDVSELSSSIGFTDSGVVSNINDLGRYTQALAANSLIAPEFAEERFADPLARSTRGTSWYTTRGGALMAGSLVGYHGSIAGYATAAYSDPETGLTVAVVLNSSLEGELPARNLAWELAALASKAPAADGQTAPELGFPWTPEQFHAGDADQASCAPEA
ncbi:serine hydrolase domain-containing protein [Microbacterium koreense]|uniref:Serine hydrolase domain-containing protein n=1 Tax=Microbacterium koreense TaxID=323761 RepID=A0ABW2ZN77_9MICO